MFTKKSRSMERSDWIGFFLSLHFSLDSILSIFYILFQIRHVESFFVPMDEMSKNSALLEEVAMKVSFFEK